MALITDSYIDLDALDGVRARMHLGWEDLAAIIGVDQSTLYRWRQRESFPRPIYQSRLQQIGELMDLLPRLFAGPDLAREWLHSARPAGLGGDRTPLELMKAGRIDRVLLLLHSLVRRG